MIRYHEGIGLLVPAARRENGYGGYGDDDVASLQFIRRTRDLGSSLNAVSALLALWRDQKRSSREVKRLAEAHIEDLKRRMRELRAVRRTLCELAHSRHGDDRSDCPILPDLASPKPRKAAAPAARRRKASEQDAAPGRQAP